MTKSILSSPPETKPRVFKRPQIHYKGLNSYTLYQLMGTYQGEGEIILENHIRAILMERNYLAPYPEVQGEW